MIITATGTFTVGPASLVVDTVQVTSLPGSGIASGMGRLVHPLIGVLSYQHPPTEWENIDGDVIAPPSYGISRALRGTSTTLWSSQTNDAMCYERWRERGSLRMTIGQFRTMLAMYLTPPAPPAFVEWYPEYCTTVGLKVQLVSFTVGGQGVTLDWLSQQPTGFVSDRDIELALRVVARI